MQKAKDAAKLRMINNEPLSLGRNFINSKIDTNFHRTEQKKRKARGSGNTIEKAFNMTTNSCMMKLLECSFRESALY